MNCFTGSMLFYYVIRLMLVELELVYKICDVIVYIWCMWMLRTIEKEGFNENNLIHFCVRLSWHSSLWWEIEGKLVKSCVLCTSNARRKNTTPLPFNLWFEMAQNLLWNFLCWEFYIADFLSLIVMEASYCHESKMSEWPCNVVVSFYLIFYFCLSWKNYHYCIGGFLM